MKKRIAIIGAGLAGLVCATILRKKYEITLFEKSRGPGGRMSTRYTNTYEFDHGAQHFTAFTPEFQAFLAPLLQSGVIKTWQPDLVELENGNERPLEKWDIPHYVAAPRMNSLGKYLAQELEVVLNTQITQLEKLNSSWQLYTETETFGPFDWIICTAPAVQAQALFPPEFNAHDQLDHVEMLGCFALMLGLDNMPDFKWQAALIQHSPIGWLAVNQSKPDRPDTACSIIVHSTNIWANENLEQDQEVVKNILLEEACQLTGIQSEHIMYSALHRWRYANAVAPAEQPYLFDDALQLAACGDWCLAGRVEAAFSSAYALAQKLNSM
ncbi:MAG: NAD(P)-binding protein [Pseudomonadota bacterium]